MNPRIRQQFKQQWVQLQVRFNALKPREQLMVTAVGVVILLVLCDQLFWTPSARSNTQLKNYIAELTTQQKQLQDEQTVVKARLAENPDAELQRNIDAVKARIEIQNKHLSALTVDLIPPDKMAEVLRQVLMQRHDLQLISLQNDPATFAFMPHDKTEQSAEETTQEPSGDNTQRLPVVVFRHGLTLQLKGRYFEIVNYLQTLEQLPWHFYWEKLDYKVDKYPNAVVTLKIYTLSNRESWIGA